MAVAILPFSLTIFSFFTLFSLFYINAEPTNESTTDFTCNSHLPPNCDTYLTYRALLPTYMHIRNISLLLGVSLEKIAQANNFRSIDEQLTLNQLLLIPIKCSCNGSYYFYNTTYEIQPTDSFYTVSISQFQNLTNWMSVIDHNPTMNPTNLTIGSKAVFPLLCKCPSTTNSASGLKYLITYVWQPHDEKSLVGSIFDVPPLQIVSENNDRNFTAAIGLPVLIPVSHHPVIYQYSSFPIKRNNQNRTLVSVLCTVGVFILIVLASLLAYRHILDKKRRRLIGNSSQLDTSDLIDGKKQSNKKGKFVSKITHNKLLPGVSGYLGQPIMYTRKSIIEATKNFNEQFRIGGSVYKAEIDGQFFAVKKINRETEELKLLQKVNHGNLISLMGISSDYEGCLLVFEYADNGSLEKWLHQNPSSSGSTVYLSWAQRLNILLDVANGLQYMHEHTQPSIMHGNINSSNILLSSRFKAKISNFSNAKYATSPMVLKLDVFSFGLMILELISGRKTMETRENGEIDLLSKEIRGILEDKEEREERLKKWFDPKIKSYYPMDAALGLACLAGACISEKYSERPNMAEIVFNLSVLTQSSPDYDRSFISGMETEDTLQIIKPVVAR